MKKILILAANPTDTTNKLQLDEEVREIQSSLERARLRDKFEIIPKLAVRVDDLQRALLDHEPHIVHFCGHGVGEQGLVLENDSGQMQLVSTQALVGLFKLFLKIECVVLNACYTEVQAEAIHKHIDCVIGMSVAISDKAAIKFAVGFYNALGAGRNYQEAFEFGCNAIDLQNIPESQTPKIKIRDSVKSSTSSKKASSVQRLKKDFLEERLKVLEENFQALQRQYIETGDADEKNRLQSKLNTKLEEIEKITQELNQINHGE